MTDDERIEAIRKRVYCATQGPWICNNSMGRWHIESVTTPIDNDEDFLGVVYGTGDASFVAHAREDIPWLLEHVTALSVDLRLWRAEAERLKACVDDAVPRLARLMAEVSGKSGELERLRWFEENMEPSEEGACLYCDEEAGHKPDRGYVAHGGKR